MSAPQLAVHLSFDGTCAEAFSFYAEILGAQVEALMTYGASPMADDFPADRDRVMHARLAIGAQHVMGADTLTGYPYPGTKGFALSLGYATVDEARRVYEGLTAGGTAVMPFAATFWAPAFGMVTDRFGVMWMVSSDEAPPAEG